MFPSKFVEEIKTLILCPMTSHPPPTENRTIYEIIWKSVVEAGRPQLRIWHMRIAYWITRAINTPFEYAIVVAFPRKQWLHERTSLLHYLCIVCLVFRW